MANYYVSKEEVINKIKKCISENGGEGPDWYIGITSDPVDRLFNSHNVARNSATWVCCHCVNSKVARDVEDYFLGEEGTMGAPGGGDNNATFVYAYKIVDGTVENGVATKNF